MAAYQPLPSLPQRPLQCHFEGERIVWLMFYGRGTGNLTTKPAILEV